MGDERARLIEHILTQQTRMHEISKAPPSEDWLSIDLTMPQLKILLLLYSSGTASMGQLTPSLGVKLPTVTGIVDRLVEQGLVRRSEDPHDRRLVLCQLTDEGHQLAEHLYRAVQARTFKVLERLTLEDLRTVARAVDILYKAALGEQQASEHNQQDYESEESLE